MIQLPILCSPDMKTQIIAQSQPKGKYSLKETEDTTNFPTISDVQWEFKKGDFQQRRRCSQRFVMHCQHNLICLGAGQGGGYKIQNLGQYKYSWSMLVLMRGAGLMEKLKKWSIILYMLLIQSEGNNFKMHFIFEVFLKSFSQNGSTNVDPKYNRKDNILRPLANYRCQK